MELWAAVGELGPFFSVDAWAPDAGWLPLPALGSAAVLVSRVASARTVIAGRAGLEPDAVEPRVAASIVSLGVFARLLSPPFGALVLGGSVPALPDLWWRPSDGGPLPLAAAPPAAPPAARPLGRAASGAAGGAAGGAASGAASGAAGGPLGGAVDGAAGGLVSGPSGGSVGLFATSVLGEVVEPVLDAFAEGYALSRTVLWGNVASALGGALTMLAAGRPDRADAAADLVGELLAQPPLTGTADLRPDRRGVVRRSCCLFYRVPGAGLCGDCVLATR